jgi:hypothetical protein
VFNLSLSTTSTGIFGKVAGKVANAGVSEDKIITKLSEALCSALPSTLGDMGINGKCLCSTKWVVGGLVSPISSHSLLSPLLLYRCAGTFEEVFHHTTFVVFKCDISGVDKIALLRGAKGEEYATKFQNMLDAFTALVSE